MDPCGYGSTWEPLEEITLQYNFLVFSDLVTCSACYLDKYLQIKILIETFPQVNYYRNSTFVPKHERKTEQSFHYYHLSATIFFQVSSAVLFILLCCPKTKLHTAGICFCLSHTIVVHIEIKNSKVLPVRLVSLPQTTHSLGPSFDDYRSYFTLSPENQALT